MGSLYCVQLTFLAWNKITQQCTVAPARFQYNRPVAWIPLCTAPTSRDLFVTWMCTCVQMSVAEWCIAGCFCLVHRGVRVIGLLVIYFTIGDPTSSRLKTAPQQYCGDACRVTLWPCASISQLRASVGSCSVRPLRPCSTGSSISLLTIDCISSCISKAHTEIHKTMPRHISAVFLKTCAIDLPTELVTVKPEFHELHWCDRTHSPL